LVKNPLPVPIHLKTLLSWVDKKREMYTLKKPTGIIILLMSFVLAGEVYAVNNTTIDEDFGTIESSSSIDLSTHTFILKITWSAEQSDAPLPRQRVKAESVIQSHLPHLFIDAISKLIIDSRRRVSDSISDSPEIAAELRKIASTGKVVSAGFSSNFSEFQHTYQYPLYPSIAGLFIRHSQGVSQIEELTYVPTGNYSGIVIYADSSLEMFGTPRNSSLKPALFPKVYNENMDLVIDMRMVDPEIVKTKGMLQYFTSSQLDKIHSRVGDVPLYVHATALFGINSTDLVVSHRAAKKIKASPHTLSLIREGKIAIVTE